MGLTSVHSRKSGAGAGNRGPSDGEAAPHFGEGAVGLGLREWLEALPAGLGERRAAAFDTRLSYPLAGGAARTIARRLGHRGYELVAKPTGFVVQGAQGPSSRASASGRWPGGRPSLTTRCARPGACSPGLGLPTPTLVVDLTKLDRNIAAMAGRRAAGVALRPHAKTHKTPEIARRQLQAGALGLTVATLGEAETFAEAGFDDLFIAYPLWVGDTAKLRRLRAVAEAVHVRVGVDSAEAAAALGHAASTAHIEALVEVDCGHHRSGVLPAAAPAVADACAQAGLEVAGVLTFPGHSYGPGMPARAAMDEAAALEEAAAGLGAAGHDARVRSGGSTPTRITWWRAWSPSSGPGPTSSTTPNRLPWGPARAKTLP